MENEFLRALSDQLTGVLQLAVKTRVENQRKTAQCRTSKFRILKHHINEPCHEKTCFCYMQTTKAQISLHILAV